MYKTSLIPTFGNARIHKGGLAIRETPDGYVISDTKRSSELPPVPREGLRMFCKFVLEETEGDY